MSVKPIPDGYHTLTPFLTVRDAASAIEFYKQAFGAVERGVAKGPDGKVMHAELKIGDSIIMLSDEYPEFGALSPPPPAAQAWACTFTSTASMPPSIAP